MPKSTANIFRLLNAKTEKIYHTHIEKFYLDESSYADIEAIDKDFFDSIELEESTGRYIITEIKKYSKPIEEIRNQIVTHAKPNDNKEVVFNEKHNSATTEQLQIFCDKNGKIYNVKLTD